VTPATRIKEAVKFAVICGTEINDRSSICTYLQVRVRRSQGDAMGHVVRFFDSLMLTNSTAGEWICERVLVFFVCKDNSKKPSPHIPNHLSPEDAPYSDVCSIHDLTGLSLTAGSGTLASIVTTSVQIDIYIGELVSIHYSLHLPEGSVCATCRTSIFRCQRRRHPGRLWSAHGSCARPPPSGYAH
jgi:hypothetical protein